ncbi:hypothetical protein ECDEC6E_1832 [Escherichia coli DEC6E]|nr:hypothetical protein ECDEC6E_1832 [Escherichia coli DEC6E]
MNQALMFFFFEKIISAIFCISLQKNNYGYNPQAISGRE